MRNHTRIQHVSKRVVATLVAALFAFGLGLLAQVPDADAQVKRLIFDEEDAEKVVGYVHKPEVGYVITRQEQEDLETLQLKESFLPKIVKSVEKKPF